MPFNIFEDMEPEVAQPQPLDDLVDSTTHNSDTTSHALREAEVDVKNNNNNNNSDTFELSASTTNHPASLKRKLDDYEEPSDPSHDAEGEDESFEEPEPELEEPSLTFPPFDTDDEFEGPTFQEWCAMERSKERSKRNVKDIRKLRHCRHRRF